MLIAEKDNEFIFSNSRYNYMNNSSFRLLGPAENLSSFFGMALWNVSYIAWLLSKYFIYSTFSKTQPHPRYLYLAYR